MEDLFKFFIKLIVTVAVIFVLLKFVFGLFRVSGNSMFPNMKDGDLAITYRLDSYNINDIVAYKGSDDSTHFGRIVANSEDQIEIREQQILLNGAYVTSDIMYETEPASGSSMTYPYDVPADSLFVLNDYRSDTNDSRVIGAVTKDQLEGKVVFLLRRRSF